MHDDNLTKLILKAEKLVKYRKLKSNVFNLDLEALNILEQIIYYVRQNQSKEES
jgi:hypothetical protein|tara:strand:- start:231 stop:392 length:162 start_codon:yes stop_codon:yes gene_type:complete